MQNSKFKQGFDSDQFPKDSRDNILSYQALFWKCCLNNQNSLQNLKFLSTIAEWDIIMNNYEF